MKLRSGRRIVHRKSIYLPTEVWVDVFCFPWITRPELAQMVDKIGNRWFGEQLQFYLHEWGKHTLGDLRFKQQGVEKDYYNCRLQPLDYPQTTMPENIKFCGSFQIDYFDNQVFNFFQRIKSLLTADTKLHVYFEPERDLPKGCDSHIDPKDAAKQVRNARSILNHLLPLIDGVHSIYTDDCMMSMLKACTRDKFHKVKMLDVTLDRPLQTAIQPTMEWLISSSNENEPKLLQLDANDSIAKKALETIRKQFMEATKPATFAVIFLYNDDFPAINCENAIGEQLCGTRKENTNTVFRNLANAEASNKLRQWLKETTDGGGYYCFYNPKQCISLSNPTIGPGNIFALPDLDAEEANDEKEEYGDEKPSTSKKRRICK